MSVCTYVEKNKYDMCKWHHGGSKPWLAYTGHRTCEKIGEQNWTKFCSPIFSHLRWLRVCLPWQCYPKESWFVSITWLIIDEESCLKIMFFFPGDEHLHGGQQSGGETEIVVRANDCRSIDVTGGQNVDTIRNIPGTNKYIKHVEQDYIYSRLWAR